MLDCTQRGRVCGATNENEHHHPPREDSDNRGQKPLTVDSMLKIRLDHVEADVKAVQEKLTLLATSMLEKSQQESSLVAQQPQHDITATADIISKVQDEIRQQLQPLFKQQEELSQRLTQTIEGRLNALQASNEMPQTQVQVNVHPPPSVTAQSDGLLSPLEQRFENMVMVHEQLEQRFEKMAIELEDRWPLKQHVEVNGADQSSDPAKAGISPVDQTETLGSTSSKITVGLADKLADDGATLFEASLSKPSSAEMTQDTRILQSPSEFEWSLSVWDASVFMGTKAFGVLGSLHIFLLLLCNTLIQVLYAYLINVVFTESNFDDGIIRGLRDFRINIAHDHKYINGINYKSLAGRLCSADPSLEMAFGPSDALNQVDGYLPRPEEAETRLMGNMQGQVMCLLSVVVWCLTVAKEVKGISYQILCLLKHVKDNGLSHKLSELELEDGQLRIRQFCVPRICLALGVAGLRMFIAVFLLIAGLKYLVHTISLRDLVLNAVALECVLMLDEVMFEAMAPWKVMSALSAMAPLPLPRRGAFKGLDFVAAFLVVMLFLTVTGFVLPMLRTEVTQLDKAREALCGGNTNFVYARTSFLPYLAWSATQPANSSLKLDYMFKVVSDIANKKDTYDTGATRMGQYFGQSWSVENTASWNIVEAGWKKNSHCIDLFVKGNLNDRPDYQSTFEAVNQYIYPLSRTTKVTECSEMRKTKDGDVDLCDLDLIAGQIARAICPVTCGCDRPNSNLTLTHGLAGCPAPCFTLARYSEHLQNTSCRDLTLAETAANENWVYQAHQVGIIAEWAPYPPDTIQFAYLIGTEMLSRGCGAIAFFQQEPYRTDLCDESDLRPWPFRSLRSFCPMSCRCLSSMLNCPKTCPSAYNISD